MTIDHFTHLVSQLDKVIIRHPSWSKALTGIQECIERSAVYREPVGCFLLAEGGGGKTTVWHALSSAMPSTTKVEGGFEKTIIPAFYAEIPSPATIKSVAASLLAKLHDPNPLSGTTAHMTARLIRLLGECETRLVFLDEFHHLFDIRKKTTQVNIQVCNWIKSLVNATKVTFCLAGLPQFAPILSCDTQLIRRFPMQYEICALHPGTPDMPGHLPEFLALLNRQILQRLGLQNTLQLARMDISLQIFAATSGNPAFIMSLAKEAALHALHGRSKELTIYDFAAAWDRGITAQVSLCKQNPFKMTAAQLAASIRSDV